jgi:TfoX N-terminal domain
MAFDEALAERVREALGGVGTVDEKEMFGGLAFLLHGNMSVGVHGDDLIVRIPPEVTEETLAEPDVREFDLSSRPMRGWVLVGPEGTAEDANLRSWVARGLEFAGSLPPK